LAHPIFSKKTFCENNLCSLAKIFSIWLIYGIEEAAQIYENKFLSTRVYAVCIKKLETFRRELI